MAVYLYDVPSSAWALASPKAYNGTTWVGADVSQWSPTLSAWVPITSGLTVVDLDNDTFAMSGSDLTDPGTDVFGNTGLTDLGTDLFSYP